VVLGRGRDQVLHLRSVAAAHRLVSLQLGAEGELEARVRRAHNRRGRDAPVALHAGQALAEGKDVCARLDRLVRAILDERPVPAGANELLWLGAAELPRILDHRFRRRRVVGARDGEPVVVEGALRAVRRIGLERGAELERRGEVLPDQALPLGSVYAATAISSSAGPGSSASRMSLEKACA
jgi:hypothetical protein